MPLFGKKKPTTSNQNDLRDIEASVREARSRLSHHSMPLTDLFGLMGEDERPILSRMPDGRPEPVRVSPDDIPVSNPEKAVPASFPSATLVFEVNR